MQSKVGKDPEKWDQNFLLLNEHTMCKIFTFLFNIAFIWMLINIFNFFVQQFLKEILNELCVYNKRGTNQGTYELKPEYKKSVEDSNAE